MNDNTGIGERIASYRKLKRLNQSELAEAVGVSKGYIAAIEEGRKVPRIKTLAIIAQRLDLKLEVLLNRSI